MSVSVYLLLTKLAESAANDALRSANSATSATSATSASTNNLSPIETARRIVDHLKRANDLSTVAKSIPIPSTDAQPADAALCANAAASGAHSATAALFQLTADSQSPASQSPASQSPASQATAPKLSAITQYLKTAASARTDAQKFKDNADTLRSGLLLATTDRKQLLLAAARANVAAAQCNQLLARFASKLALIHTKPKPPANSSAHNPSPKPTDAQIQAEAYAIFTQRHAQPAQTDQTLAAERDWFEAKANLLT